MDKVINAVNQLGIAVRGLFGEGSDANGSIFQISNQQTLGESESAIIDRLNSTLESLVSQENFAREKLLQDDRARLIDKMSRAIGSLKTCHLNSKCRSNGSSFSRTPCHRFWYAAGKISWTWRIGCLLRFNPDMFNCLQGKQSNHPSEMYCVLNC